jgi:hypothetical protein
VLTNQASAVKKSEIPVPIVIHVKVGSEKSQTCCLVLGVVVRAPSHPRELQQQRGHLDVVWNLTTDADFAFFCV